MKRLAIKKTTILLLVWMMIFSTCVNSVWAEDEPMIEEPTAEETLDTSVEMSQEEPEASLEEVALETEEVQEEAVQEVEEAQPIEDAAQEETEEPQEEVEISIEETATIENVKEGSEYYFSDYSPLVITLTKDNPSVTVQYSSNAATQKGASTTPEVYCFIRQDSVLENWKNFRYKVASWGGTSTSQVTYSAPDGYNVQWTMAYGNRYTQYNDTFTFFLTDDADDAAEVHLMIGLRPKSAWSVTAVKNIIFTKRDGSTLTHYDTTYFFRQYDEDPEEWYYEENGQYYLFNGWINQYGFISNTICYEDNLIYQPMYEKGNAIFFKDGDTILNADNPEVVYENQTIRTTDDFVMKYFPENKDGYIFEGYFNEKDGSALGSQPITENTTFVASWKAIDESAEKITFHLMTDTSELQAGAHYIITTANMLSADADKQEYMFFSTLDGNNNAIDLKFDASLTELTISSDLDCIYTASGVTVNDSTQGSAKFTAVNGQKMKLGTSSSELTPLFNEKGGTIELSYNSSKGGWMIRNSNRYLMYDENIMGFRAAYHYYNCAPLIWTDAQPKEEEEEPVVNEALYVLDQEVYSYSTEHNKKGLLVVYTDKEGKSWAMTSAGAVEVEKSVTTDTDGEKVTYIRTDKKNSWTSSDEWWTEGIDDYNCFSTISTLKSSDGKYFAVNDDGYVSDQPTGLTVVQNYSQCEINFTNWKISHLENAVLTVGYEALMIAWDAETKTFYPTQDIDKVIHVEFYRMSDDASTKKYYRLNTIEEIANADTIVIAMQSPQSDHPGARVILGKNGFAPNGVLYGNSDDGTILNVVTYSGRNMMYELKTGEVLSKGESYVKFASLSLDSYNYYYPNKVTTNGTLFGSQAKDVRLVYDKETGNIYLRGNSDSTYLSFDKDLGRFVTVDKNSDQKIAIEVYGVTSVDKLYTVTYHDETGAAKDPIFVGKEFTPLASTDTVEKDGLTYTLVGWSTKSSVTTFLSLEDSCDLYDFTDATQTGSLKAAVKEKYSIIGNCNPDKADVVETAGLLKENNIDLYPVYAVRGFESVVSANDGDIPVLGVSDWKAIQDEESQYKNVEKEKWLGKINVEVYKDGEIWLESSPVYFSYHNDDAVDLNIKFVWDSLMNGGGDQALPTDEDPLYKYVSDTSLFPEYDQSGHYVIDAVYAMQGGSEDGLKYKLNWMTDHGGQLDNVQGGSTVKIYVSNKYNVKYYLDDELISDEDWVNEKTYTTCETEEKFQADSKDASYRVTSTNLTGLMERDIETVDDQKFFNVDVFTRTEYYGFSYQMHEYEHVIPLAKTPEELVSENRYLESVNWSLKNQNMEELETAEFSQDYAVTSKSKANAYMEEAMSASFEAENVKTFHLYAYTGDQHYFDMEINITKKVTENGKAAKDTATYWFGVFEVDENDNPITENGPLYTAAIVLDNQAEGSTSVTVGTGKLGAAVKYFVAELDMDDEGNFTIIDPDATNNSISATVTYDTQLVVVDWTNQENGSVVCTNDYYKGEYKKTGVDMSMFPWVFSMGCSLLIMILLLFLKGCYVDFDKCRR